MTDFDAVAAREADVVLSCKDFDATLHYFLDDLGFRLDLIYPADSPRVALLSELGIRVRIEAEGSAEASGDADNAADDTVIETADGEWGTGRAGMQYRDLIPGRLGGRFIASHIRIPEGGPVPDYVHHHHVRFQMIYCYKGWVRLVYEDQGPPFVMHAGDCVVQPPHIRHRVLECSDAFEVVEVGCPAEHETLVDHDMELPTADVRPEREFGGQRFVFHQAKQADWIPWRSDGWEARDTGIGEATNGEASVAVVRPTSALSGEPMSHDAEFLFRFVLQGSMTLAIESRESRRLSAADSFVVPAGLAHTFSDASDDLEILEVALPAGFEMDRPSGRAPT